ncbi:hypothetical protein FKW77_009511 [Venturia effusa]|uniref:Uncharacterized protein n=1 Tax=Venturia effusa TaxID=50376 RepID=A0A517LEL1_9PEZI|nr:hypothetical protein FKW77_009511 [Venturia effusa]
MIRAQRNLGRLPAAIAQTRRCLATASPLETVPNTPPPLPIEPTPTSHVMHRSLSHSPLLAKRASGINIYTSTGQRIIDATSGAAVSCLGHSHPAIIEAMKKHLDGSDAVNYVATIMFTSSPAEELSKLLLESWEPPLRPTELQSTGKVYFCSGGSEANDSLMKLASQYHLENGQPQRTKFIARKQSYHGNTLGSLSLSHNLARITPYKGIMAKNTVHVPAPNTYRDLLPSETSEQYVERLREEYESTIVREGADTFIAFFLEPVTGATSGCLVPPPGYLQMVRDLCTKYGILMVCDEVMSGIGRCGSFHVHKHPEFGLKQPLAMGTGLTKEEREASMPDIQTVAKGLGGGYVPIAALLISGKVVDVLRAGKINKGAWVHGLTYQGHSLTCATALAVQRYIQDNDIMSSPAFSLLGSMLQSRLEQEDFDFVGNVRGAGLFWAVEFVQNRTTKEPFKRAKGLGMLIHETCLKNGLAVYPSNGTVDGKEGDHIILAPPYNVTEGEMVEIVDLLCHTFRNMESEIASLRG